jgi:hypothetical protein
MFAENFNLICLFDLLQLTFEGFSDFCLSGVAGVEVKLKFLEI